MENNQALTDRHHQEVKIPIPPIQEQSSQNIIEQLQTTLKTNEDQLAQYQRLTESLREEVKGIMAKYEKLSVFEDLLAEPPKYVEVTLTNQIVAKKLDQRCKELYHISNESCVTKIVEYCLQEGLTTRWHIVKRHLEELRS